MSKKIYDKVADSIRNQIANGQYPIGSKIPSERQLTKELKISRTTLKNAIKLLVDDGLLEQKVGSGTFVVDDRIVEDFNDVISFSQLMKKAGKTPSSKTISYKISTPTINEQKKLNLNNDQLVVVMERVRFADNQPIAYEVTSIPQKIIKDIPKNQLTESLYQSLTEQNITPQSAEREITAITASEPIAKLLKINKGDPIISIRQTSFLLDTTPFEYVRTQYAAARYQIYL